jgi:hypothetical protein
MAMCCWSGGPRFVLFLPAAMSDLLPADAAVLWRKCCGFEAALVSCCGDIGDMPGPNICIKGGRPPFMVARDEGTACLAAPISCLAAPISCLAAPISYWVRWSWCAVVKIMHFPAFHSRGCASPQIRKKY